MSAQYKCNKCGFQWQGKPGPQIAYMINRNTPGPACPAPGCDSKYCTWTNYDNDFAGR